MNAKEEVVLLVYGIGGHYEQMRRLYSGLNQIQMASEMKFVSVCDIKVKTPLTKEFYQMPAPLKPEKYQAIKAIYTQPIYFISFFPIIRKIIKKYKVKYIISTGPSISILISYVFQRLGTTVIHLETWSRFQSKSKTGRIMYTFADHFFVQNEELLNVYPKAKFKARL